jgi:hypothetical protein
MSRANWVNHAADAFEVWAILASRSGKGREDWVWRCWLCLCVCKSKITHKRAQLFTVASRLVPVWRPWRPVSTSVWASKFGVCDKQKSDWSLLLNFVDASVFYYETEVSSSRLLSRTLVSEVFGPKPRTQGRGALVVGSEPCRHTRHVACVLVVSARPFKLVGFVVLSPSSSLQQLVCTQKRELSSTSRPQCAPPLSAPLQCS